jgi:arginine decarboxylase
VLLDLCVSSTGPRAEGRRTVYAISRWGEGYFGINAAGHLSVRPNPASSTEIDLSLLAARLRDEGLSLPVLVRFDDILRHRVRTLRGAFEAAMSRLDWRGAYRPVYPIKVNQQSSVVRAILSAGGIGLEAGSKPELMAVLALVPDGETVICNGYKDRDYIRLALIGRRLGLRSHRHREALGAGPGHRRGRPPRRRAAARGARAPGRGGGRQLAEQRRREGQVRPVRQQVLALVGALRAAGGSAGCGCCTPTWARRSRTSGHPRRRHELARFYAELPSSAAGSTPWTSAAASASTTRARAPAPTAPSTTAWRTTPQAIVETAGRGLPRAGCRTPPGHRVRPRAERPSRRADHRRGGPRAAGGLCGGGARPARPPAARPGDAGAGPGQATVARGSAAGAVRARRGGPALGPRALRRGRLDLAARARADECFAALCRALRPRLSHANRRQRELLDRINGELADKLFCNFSLFQSLPDVWAIDQIFPIVPLQRLDEAPTERGVVHDLTCDSDGCIAATWTRTASRPACRCMPSTRAPRPTCSASSWSAPIRRSSATSTTCSATPTRSTSQLDPQQPVDGYRLSEPERGDSADELLSYVHFEPRELLARYRRRIDAAELDRSASGCTWS